MSRQSIIDIAVAEEGTTESPAGSNNTKYGVWYGLNGQPWCAIFVSWAYDHGGNPLGTIEAPKGYQSCQGGYNHWKASSEFTNDPQPADIVLYDWNGDGHCDHTGIFLKWLDDGNTFQAMEGNTAFGDDSNGGIVMIRKRTRNLVRAFVSPKVLGQTSPVITSMNLASGSKGSEVSSIQKMLLDLGYSLSVDGNFGASTEAAVRKFQTDHGLPVTGIVTPALSGNLESEVRKPNISDAHIITGAFIRKGDRGAAVIALQHALNQKGANPKLTEDGVFGNDTVTAMKAFQQQCNLTADGIAGPRTFSALGIESV